MDFNNIEHTPRVIFECIKRNVEAFMVPMVYGIPGCGKSALYKKLADHYNLQLIDVRLSNHESVDLTGYPVYENGVAKFVPFLELFPTEDTPIPEGYDGWLILLDEFNHASPEVLHSAHKVVLDRQVGAKNLHSNALVVAAGNREDDRDGVTPIGSAMNSRLSHYTMKVDFNEWLDDVAIPNNYDTRIIAYLSAYPEKLVDYDPVHNKKIYCVPRTWERLNNILPETITEIDNAIFGGVITPTVAYDFILFTEVFKELPTVDEIIKNHEAVVIPEDNLTKYAAVTNLASKTTEDNIIHIVEYIKQYPLPFVVLYGRMLRGQQPQLSSQPAYTDLTIFIGKGTYSGNRA